MHPITLNPTHSLAIDPYEKLRLRLIIYKNDEEYVCRKESLYKLKQFLTLDEGRAFKGRLQLLKHGDDIAVEVKGELIGNISKAALLASLEA